MEHHTTLSFQREQVPGALRHLHRLTQSFVHRGRRISFINIYARPLGAGDNAELEFIMAHESGLEGIACIDDAARAAILALCIYEQTESPEALRLAKGWLSFVEYMQGADGRFANFIVDTAGTKNLRGQTSRTGGVWWTARAMWALATAYRVTGDQRYRRRFMRGRLSPTPDLKIKAVQALAVIEMYRARPDTSLLTRLCALCDAIVASGPDYFRDKVGQDEVAMWGYHQLEAVAAAGRLLSRLDYVAACEATVRNLVQPVIASGFYHVYPTVQNHQCVYDVSTLALGLEELYRVTSKPEFRTLALECAAWLDGRNAAGKVIYTARTGCCSDGITDGVASANCGAESAIEAGFVDVMRRRLRVGGVKRRAVAALALPAVLS